MTLASDASALDTSISDFVTKSAAFLDSCYADSGADQLNINKYSRRGAYIIAQALAKACGNRLDIVKALALVDGIKVSSGAAASGVHPGKTVANSI